MAAVDFEEPELATLWHLVALHLAIHDVMTEDRTDPARQRAAKAAKRQRVEGILAKIEAALAESLPEEAPDGTASPAI